MADVKISALPAASTPLTGGEVLPIVQSSTTKQVAVSNLTAGLSGTASININGTVGETTPTTGAFTSGTFSTTLGVTGLITASANGRFLLANGATTGSLYADIQNTGGRLIIGVANSAGTSPITSSTAYSVILNSDNGTPIELAISSVTQLKVLSTGVTIPGTLGVTGASTLTGGVASLGTANSFTGTLTGVTASVTGTIYYRVIGDTVVLDIPLLTFLGTSNTTNCTITGGPSAIMPATQKVGICSIRDNGTFAAGLWRMETTGVITFLASTGGDSFVAAGSKGTYGQSIAYTKN